MTSRVIVINGDPTWSFNELLWAHGLDLYAPRSGVSFVSALPTEAAAPGNSGYNLILGNFPESFGRDADALANEIADEVTALDAPDAAGLSILAILSASDFDLLAAVSNRRTSDLDEVLAGLSESGRNTVGALRAAMQRIESLSGDQGRITRLMPRLWLSLAVREKGFSYEDKSAAERVCARLAGRHVGVRSVFLLSNGRNLDTGTQHPHFHFQKVRLLIDVLAQATVAGVDRDLQGPNAQGKALWMQLADTARPFLETSAILLQRLLEAYEQVRSGSGSAADLTVADATFAKQSGEILNDIDPPFKMEQARARLRDRLADAKRKDTEATEIGLGRPMPDLVQPDPETIALRYAATKRGKLFRNARRMRDIEADAHAFDSELVRIADVIDDVADTALLHERTEQTQTRKRIQNSLDQLQMPLRTKRIQEFRDAVRAKRHDMTLALGDAKSRTEAAAANLAEDGGLARREALKTQLIAAEGDLLGKTSLFKVPFIFSGLVLLPFLFIILARLADGQMRNLTAADIGSAVYPVPYMILIVLLMVIVVGLLRGWVVARRRDGVRAALGAAMNADYKNCIEQSSGRFVRGVNRSRLAMANVVDSRIDLASPEAIRAATEALIDTLAQTHKNLGIQAREFPDQAQAFAQPALEGFSSGIQVKDKVTGFVKGIAAPPDVPLEIALPGGAGRGAKLATHAARVPPRIRFAEPGYD